MNLTERQANIVANWMSDGDASFIQTLIGFFIYTVRSLIDFISFPTQINRS